MEKQAINFKQERDFNGLISHTFDFIKQEFKPLGRSLLTYAGPFILVTAFLSAMYQSALFSDPDTFNANNPFSFYQNMFSARYFLLIIGSVVSNAVLILVVYSYVLLYVTKGKDGFEQDEVWKMVGRNFVPVFFMLIILSFMIAVGFILFFVPGMYIAIAFSLVIFAKIAENLSFSEAINRSMYLIKDNWWFTFGVLIVIYLIAAFAGSIFLIPQMGLSMFYGISMATGDFEGTSMFFTIVTVIGTFASTLIYSIIYITTAFLYYSQVEKKEKPNLMNKIDDIE